MPRIGLRGADSAKNPFNAVSQVFGLSADEIAEQVKSGKSLDDLASEKGPRWARHGSAAGWHGPRVMSGGELSESQGSVPDSLSELLGMDSEELQDELTSGTGPTNLPQEKCVSLDDLAWARRPFPVDVRA